MSNLPEVASSPSGLEVDHMASAPGLHYTSSHQYVEQHQPLPSKGEYVPVGGEDRNVPQSAPTVCGVRRSTFWLAVILAIVVVAAAVGGGVGGSIAVSNARSNSQTASPTSAKETVTVTATTCSTSAPTPTSTSDAEPPYVPKSPKDILRIDNSCPSTIIQSSDVGGSTTDRYNCREDTDFGNNDIMWFTAYTLQACIDACSSYNVGNKTDTPCKAVALAEDMSHQYNVNNGANCWLKLGVDQEGFSMSTTVTLAWLVEE